MAALNIRSLMVVKWSHFPVTSPGDRRCPEHAGAGLQSHEPFPPFPLHYGIRPESIGAPKKATRYVKHVKPATRYVRAVVVGTSDGEQ